MSSPSRTTQWRIAAATTTPAPRAHRRWFRLGLRLAISGALLAVLIWRIPDFDADELFPAFRADTFWWLLGAAAALLAAFALQTLRWAQVLDALGHRLPYRRLFVEFLAGQFISNVLPAAVGGDVVRIARLGREIDDRPVAFASVALERLMGWIVLPAISLVTIAAVPAYQHLPRHATTVAIVVDLLAIGGLGAIIGVAANRRWSAAARSATGWRRWLGSVHLGIDSIRRRPSSIVGALVAGTAFQVTQCLSVWMTARALDVGPVTAAAALAFFPPTAIGQNAPVGFGGLGVREWGFVLFFGALGVSDERAVAVGLVGYVLTVATSALGAPAFALGGWRREVDAVEEHPGGPTTELPGS